MEDYIYINNNSLSPLLCKNIIEYFEEDKNISQGQTFGGVDTAIKDTLDLIIPNENNKDNKEKELSSKLDHLLKKKVCKDDECLIKDPQELVQREHKKVITSDGRQLLSEYTK